MDFTLAGEKRAYSIDRVMIGTVSSDAASPYFGEGRRTCVITRFDKSSGAFIAFDADGTIRTFFKPNVGEEYFRRQSERDPP